MKIERTEYPDGVEVDNADALEAIRVAVRESRYVVSAEVVAESMLSSLGRSPDGI